jgi:predicted kinase
MSTNPAANESEIETAPVSKGSLWTGRILSILSILFFLMDAVMKLLKPAFVVDATVKLGYQENVIQGLGIALLTCTILYAIPGTSVLGAILLTGYLGGAVASNLRVGSPLFSNVLFPVYFALVLWGGLYLRDKRLRALIPLRRYLRVDTIEKALRSSAVLKTDVGPAGYVVACRLAEDNLRIGRIVVADSVNSLQVTRDAWLSVAENTSTKVAEVEVICSDALEHRRRVKTRRSDIEELKPPAWQDVIDREYENWVRPHIVIDTASKTLRETLAELLSRLGFAESP